MQKSPDYTKWTEADLIAEWWRLNEMKSYRPEGKILAVLAMDEIAPLIGAPLCGPDAIREFQAEIKRLQEERLYRK